MTDTRYRCRDCGNLTRFDVVSWRRTRAFHHFDIAGQATVEEEELLGERVEEVSCRWCGHGRSIEELPLGIDAPQDHEGVLLPPEGQPANQA